MRPLSSEVQLKCQLLAALLHERESPTSTPGTLCTETGTSQALRSSPSSVEPREYMIRNKHCRSSTQTMYHTSRKPSHHVTMALWNRTSANGGSSHKMSMAMPVTHQVQTLTECTRRQPRAAVLIGPAVGVLLLLLREAAGVHGLTVRPGSSMTSERGGTVALFFDFGEKCEQNPLKCVIAQNQLERSRSQPGTRRPEPCPECVKSREDARNTRDQDYSTV